MGGGAPESKGPDPVHASLYRAAVTGGDAYRGVRLALRHERGVLRVGNRFVPEGRYRQVGFVALGHAAASMALAALDALGERLTQGFIAGPDPPPPYVPFRSTVVPDGWGGDTSASQVLEATREIALGLGEADLLLVLLSPGALRSTLLPPEGMSGNELGHFLREAHERGATGAEVLTLARVGGRGAVGGRLVPGEASCDVQCLLVERGDGARLVGGGPTVPVDPRERESAHAIVTRVGLEPALAFDGDAAHDPVLPSTGADIVRARPVVVAGPTDALRAATDQAFDKGWTTRVAFLLLEDGPERAADRFLARVDELLGELRGAGTDSSKGLVAVGMTTLGLPEGVEEGTACRRFLERARATLRRRELSVGLYRTAGPLGEGGANDPTAGFAGAVVGAPTRPGTGELPGGSRGLRMRPGITDVGAVMAAVLPSSPAGAGPSR